MPAVRARKQSPGGKCANAHSRQLRLYHFKCREISYIPSAILTEVIRSLTEGWATTLIVCQSPDITVAADGLAQFSTKLAKFGCHIRDWAWLYCKWFYIPCLMSDITSFFTQSTEVLEYFLIYPYYTWHMVVTWGLTNRAYLNQNRVSGMNLLSDYVHVNCRMSLLVLVRWFILTVVLVRPWTSNFIHWYLH